MRQVAECRPPPRPGLACLRIIQAPTIRKPAWRWERRKLLCLYSDFSSTPPLPFVCHLCSRHLPLWNSPATEHLSHWPSSHVLRAAGSGQSGLEWRTLVLVMPPPRCGTLSTLVSGMGTTPVPSVPQGAGCKGRGNDRARGA